MTATAAAALVLAAPAGAAGCRDADRAATKLSASQARHATLCLLNRERRAHGLSSLHSNRRLGRASLRHARDMVHNNFFGHVSRSGADVTARVRKAGYLRGAHGWTVGENIAWGGGALSSPRSIVRAWMNSDGHRANILSTSFRDIGLGIVARTPGGGSGGTFVTDFGRRS